MKRLFTTALLAALCCSAASAADWGLKAGSPKLQSAGPLAFGPDDVLFVGDTKSATVFAIATGNTEGDAAQAKINLENVGSLVSDVVGAEATINDLVTNPNTGNVFASVTASGKPAIVQINGAGKISKLDLANVKFSSATLEDAPEDKVVRRGRRSSNPREQAITDLAFFEGKVLVSGLRSGAAPSSVREVAFPFSKADKGVGVQIFHAAHGRDEDYSALRTFVPLMIDGKPNLLAAYTCTPLVKIPLEDIRKATDRITATTVAELGNRNRPLDMISYSRGGAEYLLLSNSARGVMKITTKGLKANDGLTERVSGGGVAGQTYETVESLQGVVQMDKLNDGNAVVLLEQDGKLNLKTVALP